ncbi:protein-L-isoaspartate(D-aspartate) O-methyltransferase [Chloroflexota bacterium]
MNESDEFAGQREHMVSDQIERRGVHDPRVLEAMRAVPRHLFIPPEQRYWSYSDGALRIDMQQTISQPYIVALMTELMELQGDETVLEVGTGSGYQAAVLAQIAAQVHSIERHAPLAQAARQVLASVGVSNVQVHTGDGTLGLPEFAPYQAIMVTAAAPKVPQSLLEQLTDGGRMVIPVGGKYSQNLEVWWRKGTRFKHKTISAVAFVPLLGDEGWREKDWKKFRFW